MSKSRNICVLRLSALGDCINAYAFILGIKRAYPSFEITWVLDKRFSSLFKDESNNPLLDDMVEIDIKKYGFLKSFLYLKSQVKKSHFHYLFNIQTSIKASLLSLAIKANKKLGYDRQRSREGQRFFVNEFAKKPTTDHVLDGYISFANACGLEVKPCFDLEISDNEKAQMRDLINTENKIFLLSPASAKAQKNWTLDGYFKALDHMSEKGYHVVLTGGGSDLERSMCNALYNEAHAHGIREITNMCGKTNLRELAALCAISDVALCPDSGTMHLLNAVNTPVVGLFAVHNPQRVGPYNYLDLCVSVYETLANKELHGAKIPWRYRVRDEKAMSYIKADDVINMLDKASLIEKRYEFD